MKSLITVDDKKHFEDFLPLFSTIISSKDSDHHFTTLKSREVHPDCFKFLKAEPCAKNGTGFCLAISLNDGTVLFVSSTVNKLLGYTKDMLLGRCFLNYLYPQDRITLANQLTNGLQAQFSETVPPQQHSENTFFCRIRQYHNLKCGFGVTDKKTRYKAFQFVTRVKNLAQDDDSCAEEGGHTICLIATATPIVSAYKASEEIPTMSSFSTRHTADCHFSHVDSSSIPYLGYLPQDILGFSIFDFYHMDDMPQLKDIYELVMKEQGNSFRSKPYRFKVSNGNYIFLETEWSCFINPWSKKLEFVVGQHRVLKGPINANVFGENSKEESVISDEILRESQRIQEEIKCLLSQPVKGFGEGGHHRCPKRKVGIASFVSSLVEEMCQGRVGNAAVGQEAKEECSCSDHGSVVMGEISPHQEYNGSDPSSMTPETSQEIRYQDNIERFFASQPKTYSSSDGSGESKSENCQQMCSMSSSYEESGKNSLVDSGNGSLRTKSESLQQVDMSQASSSRGSGGGSTENFISRNSLTEENLTQHNRLTQKYKQQQQRKVKLSANLNMQPRKEMRMKRVGSPQQLESNKHNKTSKIRGNNTVPAQAESECPPTNMTNAGGCNLPNSEVNRSGQHSGSGLQSAGHIPMGPFSLNPSFPSFIPPIMSQASSMPWSNMFSSSYTTPPYNSSIPSFGMPQQYCYMPGGSPASSAPPSPFFMPVMYFGAMPFYPPMSPVVPHSGTGIWPSFVPGQQPTPSMPGQQQQPQECSVSQDVATSTQEHNSQGSSNRYSGSVPVYSMSTMTESNSEKKVKMSVTSGHQWVTKDTSGGTGMVRPRTNSSSKSKDVITSFSGTFCKQSTPPYMVGNTAEQHKRDSTVQSDNNHKCSVVSSAEATVILEQPLQDVGNNKGTSSIMRMDEDSGYPHHARQTAIHECERDSVSMASSSSLIKSDDLSSHSPSDRTEHDLELEFKEVLKHPRRVPKDPPWMEGLEMTPDIIFRYQLTSESLEEVLKKDLEALKGLTQPDLVNKQLAMLQSELTAEADCDTGGQEDSQKEGDKGEGLHQRQAGSSSSKTLGLQQRKEVDLGFATVEDDVGEELQAKEDAILHFMCENM